MTGKLKTEPRIARPDEVYAQLMALHQDASAEKSLNSPLKKSRPSDSVTRAWFESGASSWRWDDKGIDRWT